MIDSLLRLRRFAALLALLTPLLACATGCPRAFYRQQANKEVNYLIGEKSDDPRWAYPNYTIFMDKRSRYFDPSGVDCPPMPHDDPAAHRYMHWLYGMKGYPCWHSNGDAGSLENPRWRALLGDYVELNDKGAVKLDLDSAMCLALINSNDYRTQVEEMYLSALDVSTERFRFQVQFYGGALTPPGATPGVSTANPRGGVLGGTGATNQTFFTHTGQDQAGGRESNVLATSTGAMLQKQYATGAELTINMLNTFMFQFAGPDTNSTTSILNLSLVQPLLRAGGRVVVLEQLTRVERALLSNLRAFQRYRQGFYTNVAVGDNTGVNPPNRIGGFTGGTGLTGFSGQGAGGFGEVGQATNFGRSGNLGSATGTGAAGLAGGGAGLVGGFLGMLQQTQQIRNTQDSITLQTRSLGLLEANLEAGLIDIAQVDQFRQNIQTERANLLSAQVTLANTLESYQLLILGMPPSLPMELDDRMIRQFRLVDPNTTAVQNRIEALISLLGELPQQPDEKDLTNAFQVLGELRGRLEKQIESAHGDMKKLADATPARKKGLDAKAARRFDADQEALAEGLSDLEIRFDAIGERLQALRSGADNASRLTDLLVEIASGLSSLSQELVLVQARSRLESITLTHVDLKPERAVDIARANRLDWMNSRAALVNTWRLIAFNANALKSNLDLVFSGDINTKGNNPVNFAGSNGALRVGFRFDAPFTRRLERNNYVQSLIDYQRDRRGLILYQDNVSFTLRRTLRALAQLDQNLEIQRSAVVIAVRRVDQTRENLNRPPDPVQPGQQIAPLGPTSAQNLLTALSDLRNSQNNFMSVWLNHYAARMILMRDLGVMELDDKGRWIERPLEDSDWLDEASCPLPPNLPVSWLQDAGVDMTDFAETTPEEAFDAMGRGPLLPATTAEPLRALRISGAKPMQRAAAPTKKRSSDEPRSEPAETRPMKSAIKTGAAPRDKAVDPATESDQQVPSRSEDATRPLPEILLQSHTVPSGAVLRR